VLPHEQHIVNFPAILSGRLHASGSTQSSKHTRHDLLRSLVAEIIL